MTDDIKNEMDQRNKDISELINKIYDFAESEGYDINTTVPACAAIVSVASLKGRNPEDNDLIYHISVHEHGLSSVIVDTDMQVVYDLIRENDLDVSLHDHIIVKRSPLSLDEDMDKIDSILSDDDSKETLH